MEDPDEAYNNFIEEYSRIYIACFPLKVLKGKQVASFFLHGLALDFWNPLTRRTYSTETSSHNLPHLLRRRIKPSKTTSPILFALPNENTATPKFENVRNDLQTTWKLLNKVINKRKSKSSLPTWFKSEGRTLTDPMEIANRFWKYFKNIGPKLARSIPGVNPFRFYLRVNNHPSINLNLTTTSELESICGMFASKRAPGHNSIPMHVVKYSFHLISAPLVDIINLSLLKVFSRTNLKSLKSFPSSK